MKWQDDLTLEVALEKGQRRRGLLQLCMYALHIGSANGLLCKTLRVGTIKQYIGNIASFLALFGRARIDFRYDVNGDKRFSPLLHDVYTEMKRWEGVALRQEPFTLEMLKAQEKKVLDTQAPFLSFDAAFADWSEVGIFNGQRRCEWAQESGHSDPDAPKINRFGDAQAFCQLDVCMHTTDGRRLRGAEILTVSLGEFEACFITWRTQKNGDNGQVKVWSRASQEGGHSLLAPMYRILQRFVALRGADDTTTPLALYQTDSITNPEVLLFTDSKVETAMR
jgi:hypothetical protein